MALGKAGCMAFPKCQLFDYQSVEQMWVEVLVGA